MTEPRHDRSPDEEKDLAKWKAILASDVDACLPPDFARRFDEASVAGYDPILLHRALLFAVDVAEERQWYADWSQRRPSDSAPSSEHDAWQTELRQWAGDANFTQQWYDALMVRYKGLESTRSGDAPSAERIAWGEEYDRWLSSRDVASSRKERNEWTRSRGVAQLFTYLCEGKGSIPAPLEEQTFRQSIVDKGRSASTPEQRDRPPVGSARRNWRETIFGVQKDDRAAERLREQTERDPIGTYQRYNWTKALRREIASLPSNLRDRCGYVAAYSPYTAELFMIAAYAVEVVHSHSTGERIPEQREQQISRWLRTSRDWNSNDLHYVRDSYGSNLYETEYDRDAHSRWHQGFGHVPYAAPDPASANLRRAEIALIETYALRRYQDRNNPQPRQPRGDPKER